MKTSLTQPLLGLLALVLCVPAAVCAATPDASYDANLAVARQNLATKAGQDYDRALGGAVMKLPAVAKAMGACQTRHPGDQSVQGYFHFSAAGQYTVVLAPKGPFANCLTKALEGLSLPAPPRLPWFNHFTYAFQAPKAGQAP